MVKLGMTAFVNNNRCKGGADHLVKNCTCSYTVLLYQSRSNRLIIICECLSDKCESYRTLEHSCGLIRGVDSALTSSQLISDQPGNTH